MTAENRVGEVIEARTADFIAQCYELYHSPPLGSLVRTRGDSEKEDLYGVVFNAFTEGVEPGRRPIARGKDEANEDAIYNSNPQLTKLLKSEFKVLIVGHKRDGQVFQHLPPQPAHIHSFVYLCYPEEVKQFSQSLDFLNIILQARLETSVEELVGASLREMGRIRGAGRHDFLISAGKELAALLCDDYSRLKSILKGLKYDAIQG